MRWMVMAVMVTACAQPEVIPVEPAADAGPAFDPCEWNGKKGLCFAEGSEWVFDGVHCISVCGASPGTNGTIFRDRNECATTCACRREKFAAPFALGDRCDEAAVILVAGANAPWEGCAQGAEHCALGISGPLDATGLATLCAASAYPEVLRVECHNTSN